MLFMKCVLSASTCPESVVLHVSPARSDTGRAVFPRGTEARCPAAVTADPAARAETSCCRYNGTGPPTAMANKRVKRNFASRIVVSVLKVWSDA